MDNNLGNINPLQENISQPNSTSIEDPPQPQVLNQAPEPPIPPQPIINSPIISNQYSQKETIETQKSSKTKIIPIIIGIVVLFLGFRAVKLLSPKIDSKVETEKVETEVAVSNIKHVTPSGYKRVGEELFGYIDLPENFVSFSEIGGNAYPTIAFSNIEKTTIVNIQYLDRQDTISQHGKSVVKGLESSGQKATLKEVTIDSNDAVDIFTQYSDGTDMHIYLIAETNKVKYISVEYLSTDDGIAEKISDSYSLKE